MIDFYKGLTLEKAKSMQEEYAALLKFDLDLKQIRTIAGADISFNKNSNQIFACIVILNYPEMQLKSYALATVESDFPYIPGYLAFREVPGLLRAWKMIIDKPDLVVLDGQGILHPRRMGIAAHFGLLTEIPTIGCAKKPLFGKFKEPDGTKNSSSPIYDHEKNALGFALRTKNETKPIYVSPGYGLSLEKSLDIIKTCVRKHRMPEPTRIAHEVVNQFRIGQLTEGLYSVNIPPRLF